MLSVWNEYSSCVILCRHLQRRRVVRVNSWWVRWHSAVCYVCSLHVSQVFNYWTLFICVTKSAPRSFVIIFLMLVICVYLYTRYEIMYIFFGMYLYILFIVTYLGVCMTYGWVFDWWQDLLHTCTACYYTSRTPIWQTVFSSSSSLTAISTDSVNCISQLAWDPRYIAWGRPQQKTLFPNNSSIVIEVCLPFHCIETAVLLLLHACSFPQEPSYQVVA
jgi:hypothetical protein